MNGEGWWSDGTGARGVWMYLSPPPQTTVSALENTEHLRLDKKQKNLLAHTDLCNLFFTYYTKLKVNKTQSAKLLEIFGEQVR